MSLTELNQNSLSIVYQALVTSAYLLFAILGYMFFGSDTKSVITANLGGGALASSVKVLLSMVLIISYAIQMFPGPLIA